MDVEARLLLYTVALGAVAGLAQLVRRRAFAFRVYMAELAVLLVVAAAGVLHPPWTRAVAWPSFSAFVAVAIAPSALISVSRRAARSRRYGLAWTSATTGAALLGMPAHLRREAALYGAMEAAERGDEDRCRRRLEHVARTVGIPPELGGDALVSVMPAASRRRWADVLSALAVSPLRSPPLLAVEARAASDTGDLRRALRVCRDLESLGAGSAPARSSARRSVLAAAGRASFLTEARELGMPLVAGPPGTPELAIARAHEALGDAASASAGYATASRVGRGGVRLDADAGARRCAEGTLLLATADALDPAVLCDLEAACRIERAPPSEVPLVTRAPFTLAITAVTAVASVAVFLALGLDSISLVAAGALSAPLVEADREWWRLGATMLLHAGWFHLAMNLVAIVFVGVPFESRSGWARTAIVYVASGILASMASVYVGGTPVGVGASGAAMGLMGAFGVLLLCRPHLFDDAERRRWLGALGLTVIATTVLGLLMSEAIDNTAHAGGFIAGAAIGWLLLPRESEGRLRAATDRLAATALCGALVACVWMTVARLPEWLGTRAVTAGAARAELPSWMRLRTAPDGGVVAARTPLGLSVQLGSAPSVPMPALLVAASDAPREVLEAGPRSTQSDPPEDGTSSEFADYADKKGSGLRLRTFRRGAAFALVLVLLGPDGETEGDELALRIGRSLRAVE